MLMGMATSITGQAKMVMMVMMMMMMMPP